MDVIKQYVDLLIRLKEEGLEYIKVHNEWKVLQTNEAKDSVTKAKEIMQKTEKETLELYGMLKEKGLVTGGDTPWGTEMMRYANWLTENFVPHIQPVKQKK